MEDGALRVVFGHWLQGLDGNAILFVERQRAGTWERCSPEVEGELVEATLKRLGVKDAIETLAEDFDSIEEQKLNLEGDDDDDEVDDVDDDTTFELYDMHDDVELLLTDVTPPELSRLGITVSDGDGALKLVFGTAGSGHAPSPRSRA